jgi:type IX secretion system PorP/SprF family membrane protein
MKKMLKHIVLLQTMLLACNYLQAQDLHFSQYFNAPLLVNPANTGFNPDYDYRVGGNYRNQWANVINNPYKTMNLWGDARMFADRFESGWIGVGGSILKDVAGTAGLSSTAGYLSVAYHQMLGYSSLLSLGFSVGGVNKRVDQNKLTFDNQWNGKFFDNTISPDETFLNNSIYYMDMQAGMNYAYFASDKAYINVGFSVAHLNRPTQTFFSPGTSGQQLNYRYTAFVNGNFKVQDVWILNPNIYVSKMQGATETVIGMNANRNLSGEGGEQQLILGLYYRVHDAIIPMIGYQVSDLKFTFNYDVTTSALGAYNARQGAYEVSVVKSGLYSSRMGKGIKCPTVRF